MQWIWMGHIIEMMNESAFVILTFHIFRAIHTKRFYFVFADDINKFPDYFVIIREKSNLFKYCTNFASARSIPPLSYLRTYFAAGIMNIISEESLKYRLNRLKRANLHKSNWKWKFAKFNEIQMRDVIAICNCTNRTSIDVWIIGLSNCICVWLQLNIDWKIASLISRNTFFCRSRCYAEMYRTLPKQSVAVVVVVVACSVRWDEKNKLNYNGIQFWWSSCCGKNTQGTRKDE